MAITASFRQQWSDDVKHAFQQMGSRLRPACRVVTGVEGDRYNFNKLASTTVTTKTRNQDVTINTPTHSIATATLEDRYSALMLDKLDMNKVMKSGDMRKEYVMSTASAINRFVDDQIIAAMDAGHTNLATTPTGLTFPRLLDAVEKLNEADVDAGERYLVVGAKQISEALAIEQLTSADYSNLLAVQQGHVKQALGFTWVLSNRLTLDTVPATDERQCYAFNKSAVGVAFGDDVMTEINYVPEKVGYLVNTMVSMNAVTIEDAGVVELRCQEA